MNMVNLLLAGLSVMLVLVSILLLLRRIPSRTRLRTARARRTYADEWVVRGQRAHGPRHGGPGRAADRVALVLPVLGPRRGTPPSGRPAVAAVGSLVMTMVGWGGRTACCANGGRIRRSSERVPPEATPCSSWSSSTSTPAARPTSTAASAITPHGHPRASRDCFELGGYRVPSLLPGDGSPSEAALAASGPAIGPTRWTFEIVPVQTSEQAAQAIAPKL